MKKRHSIHLLLAAAALLLATAACTKDELADGDRLPEGQYPLQIAAVTLSVEGGEAQPWGTPATRVSENGDGTGSKFDAGDPFAVQIDGEGEVGTYTVQDDGTATSDAPLYWTNTTPNRTVSAWYPATDGTLDLGDQSQSLAYLLSGSGTGDYQTPVTLTFTHQLAKVRVTPIGDALDEVTSLQLYTYTRCTYEKGEVVQGSQEDWIEMMKCEYTENGNAITCWEANVVPGYEITKLRANGTEERNLSAAITPEAGKFYDITLDKDKGYTDDGQGNYIVTTAEGLKAVADIANNGNLGINITLTENINLTDMEWTPIGTNYNNAYTGIFDGNGKTITGLTVTGSDQYAGLFGRIGSGGTVKNVVLEGVQITSDNSLGSVGGVAGYSYGNIEYCSVSGSVSVSGISDVGGVVGYQVGGSITGCSSSATVKGTQRAGGMAGVTNSGASLTGCYATGDVTVENDGTDTYFAGGVVGSNGSSCTLKACYAWGSVTGSGSGTVYTGGVTGSNDLGTLTACYHAKGTVKGSDGATGGVAGRNYKGLMPYGGIITACYWGDNGQTQGIGEDQVGTGGTTQVTDGNWQNAVTQMNAALSGKGWQYELKDGNSLPALKKEQ